MAKRSLQATQEGARIARKAFDRKGWTQENLASELELKTRQPIWRFFTCRPIERHIFVELCSVLDLNWWEIAEQPPEPVIGSDERAAATQSLGLDGWIKQVRAQHQDAIEHQCNVLRILDTSRPIRLDEIYIDVLFKETVASQECLEIFDDENTTLSSTHCIQAPSSEGLISGIELLNRYTQLRILGKPGSGKTTFLKHIALKCNRGEFEADRVPMFIALDQLAEDSKEAGFNLFNYICQELLISGITDQQIVETLLHEGRMLLILDGLDDVRSEDKFAVFREVCKFSERYYKNRYIIATRLSSQQFEFSQFTDVEVADLNWDQTIALSQRWFQTFSRSSDDCSLTRAAKFIQQLALPEHQRVAELAKLPLFFNQICQTFQQKGKLTGHQVEIYEACLDILLKKWDVKRGIQRPPVRQGFSTADKLNILNRLATLIFEQDRPFLEQREIEQCITDYLRSLPNASLDLEVLQQESEMILRAIEFQHGLLVERARGIFSFSHTVFQEYFLAKSIISNANLEQTLTDLAVHLTEASWRDIFLILCSMLQDADLLLRFIKTQVDDLTAQNPCLLRFINWTRHRSIKLSSYQQLTQTQALYRLFARSPELLSGFSLHLAYGSALWQYLLLDELMSDLSDLVVDNSSSAGNQNHLLELLDKGIAIATNVGDDVLKHAWTLVKSQLTNLCLQEQEAKRQSSIDPIKQVEHVDWRDQLQQTITAYYDREQLLVFSSEEKRFLRLYCHIVQLLRDCLMIRQKRSYATNRVLNQSSLLPQFEAVCEQIDHALLNTESKPAKSDSTNLLSERSQLEQSLSGNDLENTFSVTAKPTPDQEISDQDLPGKVSASTDITNRFFSMCT
jgi:adenylate kinase family enzyme